MLKTNGALSVSRKEFSELRREVRELRVLIAELFNAKEDAEKTSDTKETLKSLKARAKSAGVVGADRMTREQLTEALGE